MVVVGQSVKKLSIAPFATNSVNAPPCERPGQLPPFIEHDISDRFFLRELFFPVSWYQKFLNFQKKISIRGFVNPFLHLVNRKYYINLLKKHLKIICVIVCKTCLSESPTLICHNAMMIYASQIAFTHFFDQHVF